MKALKDYPYTPEEHKQIIRRLKNIGHLDPDLPEDYPQDHYREIPPDRVLSFDATPAFKGWKPLFVEASKDHPAKMNLNLLKWIIDTHSSPGDIILDPMSGTGSTMILAFLAGRHGVAVEYEDTFFYMAEDNMEKTRRQAAGEGYIRPGPKGRMTLIHGDARELSSLLEASDVIVSSPPYGNRLADAAVRDGDPARVGYRQAVDVVFTSPPYSDVISKKGGETKLKRIGQSGVAARMYSRNPGNIGNLRHGDVDAIVTSPPYGPSQKGGGIAREGYTKPGEDEVTDPGLPLRHGRPLSDDPRNIDNLEYGEVDAVVTSPPYEASIPAQDESWLEKHWDDPSESPKHVTMRFGRSLKGYSGKEDNLGNLKGETYLESMLRVYRECWKVLKPGGRMILVVKNFNRDKKVVRLDLDTIKLCEAAGFHLQDRWYFKLPTRSFWRILYHKKYPNVPEVDYEDVLVFEKNGFGKWNFSAVKPEPAGALEEAVVA